MQKVRLYLEIYDSRLDVKSVLEICNSDWDLSVPFDQDISGKVVCTNMKSGVALI